MQARIYGIKNALISHLCYNLLPIKEGGCIGGSLVDVQLEYRSKPYHPMHNVMKKTIFTGAGVAIVTPMREDGSIHYAELERLIEFQIANKTDAIIICGTTGESSTLVDEEHLEAIRFTIEKVNKRLPVIAGTGGNDTVHALNLCTEAANMGADALLTVTPYYNKTSQAGLIRHFTYLADRVSAPLILYNVPGRTGLNIKPETYAALAGHPNIVGIKEANGDIGALVKTMALCGDQLDVYSGNDDQITSFLSLGAKGVISVLSNVVPQAIHDCCQSFFSGDIVASRRLQMEYYPLFEALFSDVSPIPAKAAMQMMGFAVGECRMPLTTMSESGLAKLRECLTRYKLIAG